MLNLNKLKDYIFEVLLIFKKSKKIINNFDSDYLIENIIINQFSKFFNELNFQNINTMNLRSFIESEIDGTAQNIRNLNKNLGLEYIEEKILDEHHKKLNYKLSNRDSLKQLFNEWIEINSFLNNLKSKKINIRKLEFGDKNEQIINYANNLYSINERFLKKINQVIINKKEKKWKYTLDYLKILIATNINNSNLNNLKKYIDINKKLIDEIINFEENNKIPFRNDPEHNKFITNYSYKECLFYLFIQSLFSLFITKIINLIPNILWSFE
ncbi:hypothetical protein [Spiroplasma endosymbiont of Andrena trimmerana]|uniref:hypothetical protein n=1 Tax=Spiroplasma endosymbiont of Andrena trimmerana TaxID=3066316 RepID=UPI0030D2AF03